jgi:hypothetical protein
MAIWKMRRSPSSDDTQEVGSIDPTLWEADKEPQVMGAKTRRDRSASRTYSSSRTMIAPTCAIWHILA